MWQSPKFRLEGYVDDIDSSFGGLQRPLIGRVLWPNADHSWYDIHRLVRIRWIVYGHLDKCRLDGNRLTPECGAGLKPKCYDSWPDLGGFLSQNPNLVLRACCVHITRWYILIRVCTHLGELRGRGAARGDYVSRARIGLPRRPTLQHHAEGRRRS